MLELSTSDVWTGIAGLLVLGGGVLTYFKSFRSTGPAIPAPTVAVVPVDRDQIERLIGHVNRLATAAEKVADRRQDEMSSKIDRIEDLLSSRK